MRGRTVTWPRIPCGREIGIGSPRPGDQRTGGTPTGWRPLLSYRTPSTWKWGVAACRMNAPSLWRIVKG